MTSLPLSAQAGGMPKHGELLAEAARGNVDEMQKLIEACANIDERNGVSNKAGTSVAEGVGVW